VIIYLLNDKAPKGQPQPPLSKTNKQEGVCWFFKLRIQILIKGLDFLTTSNLITVFLATY
jgi:hypothetical protein